MFTGKWVICVFSYNRVGLLQNLLASIHRFYPEFHIAIFDDNSDDAATKQFLTTATTGNIKVIINNQGERDSKHGGLYHQMNSALAYTMDNGYDYAYFVQDDMQFLWRDEHLAKHVIEVFNRDECLMCNSSFLQKILTTGIEQRLPMVEEGLFTFAGNGVADTGIIHLAKAKKAGLHFYEQSERGNGNYWHDKGYRLYWLPQPHLAWVPWPTTFRDKQKENRQVRILKPLSTDSIEKIRINQAYAYLEDYTGLYGLMLKPYWYTANPGWLNLLKIYTKYYIKQITG